jgi:magnesium transporter
MRSWLHGATATIEDPASSVVADTFAANEPFWLDIENPTDDVIDRFAAHLALHPLAVEDSKQFGQRGKIHIYGDVAMMVGFGLDTEMREPVEVHCYYTTGFLITLHRGPSAALDQLRRTGVLQPLLGGDPFRLLHQLILALHAPFPILIDQLDDRLGSLERRVLEAPKDEDLAEIVAMEQRAAALRRTLAPGRELSARATLIAALPGATAGSDLYASDIHDELVHIADDLAMIAGRCQSLLGLHASLSSNRQAVVARRLAVVATIFLPITFVVSFFGQNFDVLSSHIEHGWLAFLILGVALNVVCLAVTVAWLRRRGWD